MAVNVKAVVGAQRISGETKISPAEANYTRAIRSQMQEIIGDLKEYISNLENVTPEALLEALRPTFEISQQLVPVKTGALKRSGYLEVHKKNKGAEVVIGYGKGGNPPYAALVHELVDVYHEPPTQSRFLLAAIEQDYYNILTRVTENLSQVKVRG